MQEKNKPKVVIMYLLWDQEPYDYLKDAIEGVKRQSYSKEQTEFLIVYNSFKDGNRSACSYIREEIAKHEHELPHVTILEQQSNLGFSGGNNFGMQWGVDNGFDYVFLHNGDGYLGSKCIEELVEKMEGDRNIGAAQALMFLHPETDLINSAGNCFHYLGIGYTDLYRKKKTEVNLPEVKDVGYLSGAAIMMRTDLLSKHGLWDEDYFLYHEDTDYTLRLKLLGYRAVLVRDAEFFHKYQFSKSIKKYYWMERNRLALLLVFYKWPTLILILPLEIVFELGLLVFSFFRGWHKERFRVYVYWLQAKHWRLWLKKRKKIQLMRTVPDRELLKNVVSDVKFQEGAVENPVLTYIGNPVMRVYWWVVQKLIWW